MRDGPAVTLHVADALRFFLRARHRATGAVTVRPDGTSTLGHLVESCGVPLTEVGDLRVDGRPADPAYRPQGGEDVQVPAVRRPQPAPTTPPRFVLDVHLGTLARRLRLLGVDAAYRNDADDAELVEQAAAETRVLLTQDRGLLRRRAVVHGAYVRGLRPDDQLRDVVDRFELAPAPFTRCTACNSALSAVAKQEVLDALKPGTWRSYDEFSRCLACGKVYWRGAHAQRLDDLVAKAASEHPDPRR